MNANPRHVIFGTGAIGLATLDALRRRGESVRLVNRSGTAPVPDDVEIVQGDASDPGFTTAAAEGARSSTRPSPRRTTSGWSCSPPCRPACSPPPKPPAPGWSAWRTSTCTAARPVSPSPRPAPTRPTPRKGRLRARMARELLAAHQAGRVEVAIGRASDYFGPRGGALSNLGDRVFPPALAGKTATVMGDPDQPHTYTYLPDIGEGLAVLGEHPDAPGEVWHLPNDPDTRTTRQLVDSIYRQAGQPRTKLRGTPTLLLRALGVVNPTVRELVELQYEFQEPFIVDSSKIASKLGVHATPLEQALADTLASYPTGT